MYSYWEKEYWFSKYDIIIVGSGIVGLSSAYYLNKRNPSLKIGILDHHFIPLGASTRNAGFACFGTVGEILDDLNTMSVDLVKEILNLRWDGLQKLRQIHKDEDIDYAKSPGIELFKDSDSFNQCESRITDINDIVGDTIGVKNCFRITKQQIGDGFFTQAIINDLEGSLNPVKMVRSLIQVLRKQNIEIINGVGYKEHHANDDLIRINTDKGFEIAAEKLIFCTNAFTKRFFPELDIAPARNQVIITEKIPSLNLKGCYHFNKGYMYFRAVDGRLLIGGARHIDMDNEMTSEFGENQKILNFLTDFTTNHILKREFKVAGAWSGIIATGQGKKPIIEEYDKNVYVAARLGGMGVAIGSELGYQVSKLVLD